MFFYTAKKTKKVSNNSGGKENNKKTKASKTEKESNLSISSQHELVITQILGDCSTPQPPTSKTVPPHPHFGGKQPKQHKPPKCISVVCKEEKESLEEQLMDIQKELDDTRKELEKAQEELSECNP